MPGGSAYCSGQNVSGDARVDFGKIYDSSASRDLYKLTKVRGATMHSQAQARKPRCLQGTQARILQRIYHWAANPNDRAIFWLNGKAGMGKSAIARTVAHTLFIQKQLAASFFFESRAIGRNNAGKIFPNIAAQLLSTRPEMAFSVKMALDRDPSITDQSLENQFENLIFQPMVEFTRHHSTHDHNSIVVIDALDECEEDFDIGEILRLLSQDRVKTETHLRWFVTSRPELQVRLCFAEIPRSAHYNVLLHEIAGETVECDINAYFRDEFDKLRNRYAKLHPQSPLDSNWPGESAIKSLVELSTPLFMFAAGVCRFISDLREDPRKRLKAILENPQTFQPSDLKTMYSSVLDYLVVDEKEYNQDLLATGFRELVGPMTVLVAPFSKPQSTSSLASLLDIDRETVCSRLGSLHSVLDVPNDPHTPVRFLHRSFRNFLVDRRNRDQSHFWVDEQEMHATIVKKSLQLLCKPGILKKNICDQQDIAVMWYEAGKHTVDQCIPPAVAYACQYLVYHLGKSKDKVRDNDIVHKFLTQHFVHWMEVLAWRGLLYEGKLSVLSLRALIAVSLKLHVVHSSNSHADWVSKSEESSVSKFVINAGAFIIYNTPLAIERPLLLYSTSAPYAPRIVDVRHSAETHGALVIWDFDYLPEVDSDEEEFAEAEALPENAE